MCIALLSTAHPKYKLILIDNRDEFLNRPTARASFWPEPNDNVLGGRDLLRPVQGTWLGVTREGKVAVLTNYREDTPPNPSAVSRGAIIRKFLTEDVGPLESFVEAIVHTGIARDAGGFSLVCGNVGEKLAVISNRAEDQGDVPWILGDQVQTVGLSNANFLDRSWGKVTLGEQMMLEAIRASEGVGDGEDGLIKRLLEVLSHDTLPRNGSLEDMELQTYITELRKSILVPPIGRTSLREHESHEIRTTRDGERVKILDSIDHSNHKQLGIDGVYATQKQTVVLVDHNDRMRFFERTLYDEESKSIPLGEGDVDVQFQIQC